MSSKCAQEIARSNRGFVTPPSMLKASEVVPVSPENSPPERESLLAELDGLLAASRSGGRIALVTGEAGIGKSTLVRRFAERHADQFRVLIGRCDPAPRSSRRCGPWRDIAREAGLRTDAADDPSALLEGLARTMPAPVIVVEDLQWADEPPSTR